MASCFLGLLGWASASDLRAVADAFEDGRDPDPDSLQAPARRGWERWRLEPGRAKPGVAQAEAERLSEALRALGADVLHPLHSEYPQAFAALEKPPVFLSRIGAAPWMSAPCVSIFGGREPSDEALGWMYAHLPDFFAATGAFAASGGARGVDQRAHALSLSSARPTAVFLPSGLAVPYPSEIKRWFGRAVEAGGAVLSERLPNEPVRRSAFERRNRMIAAIGLVAFAVEGRKRSGTTMTARLACDLGRPVACLSSSPMNARGFGTLDLLRDGATLIRDAEDLACLLLAEHERERATAGAVQPSLFGREDARVTATRA